MPNESFALTWGRRHKVSLRRILTQQARSGKQSHGPWSRPSTGSKNYQKCVSKLLSTWLANRTVALLTGQSWRLLKSCYTRWDPEQLGFWCWILCTVPIIWTPQTGYDWTRGLFLSVTQAWTAWIWEETNRIWRTIWNQLSFSVLKFRWSLKWRPQIFFAGACVHCAL